MKKLSLLVVDDDDLVHKSIEMSLPDQWRMSSHYSSENLPQGSFLAAFVDMHFSKKMDKAEGLQVIRKLSEAFPHLEIIAMSGDLDRALMEDCLAAGASRFIAKPLSLKEIQLLLDKIEALHLMHLAATRQGGKKIQWIGNGQESKKIRQKIAHFRGEPGPILICGESGTGKEVATTLLHEQEGENRPFIRLNVAAVPETLFESELFGHVKGAFTGADQNKMGLAEAANGGDLFLDEIEALSLPLQVKLLRFLESNEVRRVGGQKNIKVNTRIIAASNRNLQKMVQAEEFREDLYWRLNGKSIELPPLRKRLEDIKELVLQFLSLDDHRKKEIDEEALETLMEHKWPGNVRELRRVCEQLILYSPLPIIRKQDVLPFIQSPIGEVVTSDQIPFHLGLSEIMNRYESVVLREAIEKYSDIDQLIGMLQISRSGFYKKVKDYGIDIKS